MAKSAFLKSLFGVFDGPQKRALHLASDFLCDGNLRFGPVEHQTRSENFAGVYVNSTTSSTANDEFTVAHGLGRRPVVFWQVMNPLLVGSKSVRLEVTRAGDESRLYLRSPESTAAITLYIEA